MAIDTSKPQVFPAQFIGGLSASVAAGNHEEPRRCLTSVRKEFRAVGAKLTSAALALYGAEGSTRSRQRRR